MPTKDRPFSLSDAMVLVAAIALGTGLSMEQDSICKLRHTVGISYHDGTSIIEQVVPVASDFEFSFASIAGLRASTQIQWFVLRFTPALSIGTLATLALRLRRPRPSLNELARRPGTVATVAVVFALAAVSIQWPKYLGQLGTLGGFRVRNWWGWRMFVWYSLPRPAGFAVALSWSMLRLSGQREADSGWHDRLGRLLGVCWAGMAVASVMVTWVYALWL